MTTPASSWTPVSWKNVTIDDAFWSPRLRVNREQSLPHIYEFCQQTGRIDALRLNWKPGMEPVPHIFWDSDVAKWLEAASYSLFRAPTCKQTDNAACAATLRVSPSEQKTRHSSLADAQARGSEDSLATHPDPALEARVDEIVGLLVAAQQPDGYLNSYFTAVEPEKRWTNLRDWHELYCAGHLIEAAVAHFQATGKRMLLDALCRYADYIDSVFGPEEGKKHGYPGHEEIELALVKLYRVTGEERYLRLSQYFINERGRQPHYYDVEARQRGEDPAAYYHKTYEYNQSHLPVREQKQVVGHAVRAMYFYSAVTDIAGELHDQSLFDADQRLWQQLCSKRLYITGGLGPSAHNEGFTSDYDLPNETAYAETCAAIGFVFWNHRMLQLDCNARYADMLERALYNGVLSGVSLDGRKFFYVNPLESSGGHHRQEWFSVSCCPPNIARLFASLGQYIYAANDSELAVHLYIQSTARVTLAGREVAVRQETNYPRSGGIALSFAMDEPASFALRLRIPGWSNDARLLVNGEAFDMAGSLEQGYVRVERTWQPGDRVELELAMPVERVYAHPGVRQDAGLVALQRGPLIYCLEAADAAVPLHRIVLPETTELTSHFEPELLGGVTVIRGEALIEESADWANELYRTRPPSLHAGTMTAIPYYAWDNRQPGEMRVWLRSS